MDYKSAEFQFLEEQSWINDFIKFKLGIDGISILFITLTTLITPICIISCINSVKERVKEFLIAILILETFMIGVRVNPNVFDHRSLGWTKKSILSF
jgi:NADH-quinone oxidoreductase subunit M